LVVKKVGENHRVGVLYVGAGGASTDLLPQQEAARREQAAIKRSVMRFMRIWEDLRGSNEGLHRHAQRLCWRKLAKPSASARQKEGE
jgi:hypothetical protein